MHPSLRLAGLLPPLDCPHHLRKNDECVFREGVVLETPRGYGKTKVDVGLDSPVEVDTTAPQGTRVTVRMTSDGSPGTVPDHAMPNSASRGLRDLNHPPFSVSDLSASADRRKWSLLGLHRPLRPFHKSGPHGLSLVSSGW
jgi:hypothetical protein